MIMKCLNKFWESEAGAITVDWVVLTAAIAGIGFAVMMVVAPGIGEKANEPTPDLVAAPGMGASLVVGEAES